MIISLVVALDKDGGIGWRGRLPWRLSSDLKRFKALTMGHHLIMGRKTFESIGKPLPGRTSIVLTRNPHYHPEGALTAPSLEEALALAHSRDESEAFVIGGGQIFRLALPLAERIYLTQVHAQVQADTFFPRLDPADWVEVEAETLDAGVKDQYPATFKVLERRIDRRHK